VGRDFAVLRRRRERRRHLWVVPIATGLILAMLLLASIRVHGIQIRYQLAERATVEERLLMERSALLAEVRRLRDPKRLQERAEALGLARPERVIRLAAPDAGAGARP
jgi:hypothetical protein